VRVDASPGSANGAFARANFPRAEIAIDHDNAGVFLELVPGRADVMVTDGPKPTIRRRFTRNFAPRRSSRRTPARKGLQVRASGGDEGLYRWPTRHPHKPAAPGVAHCTARCRRIALDAGRP
jgi:hypothetical protein